ncbi:hypothetical protein M408DRAFT_332680 [Serendipita vermifera MAFF 305830]|uniref:RBR-type E3 ubiquitin transferase n=1 Tax=Serendipita vermifera MAFF 305830 TaxID=933852 RepID=A0A0C3AIU3_SERVB|nr:hypothetical protein M408DRAFT_334183 [Serendipita vermifera MAFF 305830]KIM22911.1 hypothetical protein M408DRAFT_332680 [Serendipita vermifera MAFF 305830]
MWGWKPTLNLGALSGYLYSSTTPGPTSESSQNAQVSESTTPDVPSGVECIVCRNDTADVGLPDDPPTLACSHQPQVCLGCLQQTILVAVTNGDYTTGIPCASPGCAQRLDYFDIQRIATPEVFDRYAQLLLQDSDEHYVLCLEPSCAAGQEHTGGEGNNIVTCYSCGTKQCFRHQVLWHEGFTCAQWDEHQGVTVVQQEMSDEWIQANTKPCPRCSCRLEKAEGCDHFTCKPPGGCGHQFCWKCLAPWAAIISGDNSRHYDHCSYYSGLPGRNPAPPTTRTASASTGQTSQNAASQPSFARSYLANLKSDSFDVVRTAQTRAPPPATNRQAESRQTVLRHHTELVRGEEEVDQEERLRDLDARYLRAAREMHELRLASLDMRERIRAIVEKREVMGEEMGRSAVRAGKIPDPIANKTAGVSRVVHQ